MCINISNHRTNKKKRWYRCSGPYASHMQKQSKLTDVYLVNLLGEDVYRDKITSLKGEEDELKKLLARYELREIEGGNVKRIKNL